MNLNRLRAANRVLLAFALSLVSTSSAMAEEAVKATSDVGFSRDVIKTNKIVLVDFYADWCGPCRKLSPAIESLAKKYAGKIEFYKLNVDQCPKVSGEYNINAIPAIKIFKGGKVVSESVGGVSEASIDARLESALK